MTSPQTTDIRCVLFDLDGTPLDRLEAVGMPWGIVTNQPGRLTAPLLEHLELRSRAASIVSGATPPLRRPDPVA